MQNAPLPSWGFSSVEGNGICTPTPALRVLNPESFRQPHSRQVKEKRLFKAELERLLREAFELNLLGWVILKKR